MQFCEKLDFLMSITKTSNSALAQKVKLDASYISRLRKGQRRALKDISCIKSMAEYFAKNCKEQYQHKSVLEALKIRTAIADNNVLSELIYKWLTSEGNNKSKAAENFLAGVTSINSNQAEHIFHKQKIEPAETPKEDISVYYGVQGKRQAAVHFLAEAAAQSSPQVLLLYSDESTDWMTADPDFTSKWVALMVQVLSKGNRIKIIHTVSRDLDEMLSAIRQWMPLYMTGLIEPYFYPKKRDGIFKRTLFISPGVSAVISSSIGTSIDNAANMFIKNSEMISAYTEEFNQYLSLCKPLIRIYTMRDNEAYYKTLLEFENEKSNSFIKTQSLSLLTMPEKLAIKIMERIGVNDINLIELQACRKRLFENNIKSNAYTEIIQLFDAEKVKSGKIKIASSEMLIGNEAYYTLEEYILHLENIVRLLKKYENFHVYSVKDEVEAPYMVYAKEDLGAIIAKTSAPPVAFAVNEANLATAFWDFLKNMIGEKAGRQQSNTDTALRLKEYIDILKN